MKFFTLAGGYGKRAEPLSLCKPKPAFPLGGTPLIALLLRQLRALGCAEGFINLHHLGNQIVAAVGADPGVRYIEEKELSGSLVLRQALPFFSDWLLVINGDTFFEIPLAELSRRAGDAGVDAVLVARRDDSGRYAHLRCEGDDLLAVVPAAGASGFMYAGAALFRSRAVARIDEANFFVSVSKHGLRCKVVLYDGIWLDVGTPASYFQANWEYMNHCLSSGANALSPGAVVSPGARVERSILWEDVKIGPEVQISECIVTGGLKLEKGRYRRQIISRGGVFPLC